MLPLVVLAIDPGTVKCGVAVVQRRESTPLVLHREIVETARLVARVLAILALYPIESVLVGNATNGKRLERALRDSLPTDIALHSVDEAFTSQRARTRFNLENTPRGLTRLLPLGLRTPPRPYDDYVAVLLAEDYFASDGTELSRKE